MDKNFKICNEFLLAYQAGKICLHPTDTIPGLTADPDSLSGMEALKTIKGRMQTKPFVGLVSGLEVATDFWQPLPSVWPLVIEKLWPCSLSIVWDAAPTAPQSLLGAGNSLCLRHPHLQPEDQWFVEVLGILAKPLPTTSVNLAGEAPATNWTDAIKFVQANQGGGNIFAPQYKSSNYDSKQPSTIIKLLPNGDFQVLRVGSLAVDVIIKTCSQLGSKIKLVKGSD